MSNNIAYLTETEFHGVDFIKYIFRNELAQKDIALSKGDEGYIRITNITNVKDISDIMSLNESVLELSFFIRFRAYDRHCVDSKLTLRSIVDIKNNYKYNSLEGTIDLGIDSRTFHRGEDNTIMTCIHQNVDHKVIPVHYNNDELSECYTKYLIDKGSKADIIQLLRNCFADVINDYLGLEGDNKLQNYNIILRRSVIEDAIGKYTVEFLDPDKELTIPHMYADVIIQKSGIYHFSFIYDAIKNEVGKEATAGLETPEFIITRDELIEKYGK